MSVSHSPYSAVNRFPDLRLVNKYLPRRLGDRKIPIGLNIARQITNRLITIYLAQNPSVKWTARSFLRDSCFMLCRHVFAQYIRRIVWATQIAQSSG